MVERNNYKNNNSNCPNKNICELNPNSCNCVANNNQNSIDIAFIFDKIDKIEKIAAENKQILTDTNSLWKAMEYHMKHLADSMKEYGNTNKDLINLVAGKKQVPISIYMFTTLVLSIAFFIIIVYFSKIDLNINKDGVRINPNQVKETE